MDYKNKEKEEKKVIKAEDKQKKLQEDNAKKNKEQEDRRKAAEAAKRFDEENKKQSDDVKVDLSIDKEKSVEDKIDDEFRTYIMDQSAAKRKLNVSNKGDFKRVQDFMTYSLDEEGFMNNTWSLTDEEKQRIIDTRDSWWFGKKRAKKLQKKLCQDRNFKIGAGLFAQRRALQAVLADEIDKGEAEYEKYGMRSTKDIYIESKNLLKCHYIEGTLGEKFKAFWGYKPHSKVNVAAAAKHAVNSSVYCEIQMRQFAALPMIVDRQIDENAKKRLIALCKTGYVDNMLISDSMDVHGHKIQEDLQKKARMRASLFEMLQFFIENAGSDVFFSAGISTWGQLFKVANDAAKAAASSVGNMGKEEKKAYYTAIMNGVITNKIREARLGLEGIYDLKKKTEEIEKKEENKAENKAENKDAKKEEKKEEKKDAGAENKDGDQKQGEVKDEKKDKKKKKKKEEDAYGRSEEEIAEDNRYIRAVKIAERDVAQKEAKAAEHKAQETAVWKAVWGACHTFDASDAAAKDADEKWIRGVQRNELAWMKDRLEDINNTVANFTFSEEMKNPEEYIKTHFKEYMKLRGYFMAYEKLTDLSWFKGEQKEYSAIKDFFKDKRGSYLLIFGDQKAREIDKKRIAPWKLFQSVVDRLLIQKGYNPDMTGDVSGYVTREQWKNAQWKDEKEKTDTIDKAVKTFEKNNAELLRDEFVMNYAHFYGYKDAETKADHEGFQEKIVNLLDKTAKPGTEAGLQKVLGGLKVDLQGAIDSIKGMVKYFNRYPVAKYPDMYKNLEAFTSKKETPETLAEKLTSLSLTYNGYLDFINKYNNNDKLVTGVVEEALNDKTADFRELVERGNQTVIANHYVKGGDYKTFRAVNKMNDYYSKYNKDGYGNDYLAALDYVENFKFSKEWFKADYVMENIEKYLRFNFSIKTIRENSKEVRGNTTKLHQAKIDSILALGDAFMRIVNHNMAEKYKVNCGGGGYATDQMVNDAVKYRSKENKKAPELEDFKQLNSIADLIAWNEKHMDDPQAVMHDYVWDHTVFELGLKDLQKRDYKMKVVNGKSEYADYLRLLVIKTRQMDSKGLNDHQKSVFAGQLKLLASRALICLQEGKFSRIDGFIAEEDKNKFDDKVIDILNGFVNGTRQEGDLDTILQAFNKEQEYRAKYIESVRKKRKYESETKMSNARFSRKLNVGFSMKYEAKKLTGIVQKEAEKLLSILDIEIENQTSEDVKKKLENISTLIREGLKPENAEGAEPMRSIADALEGVDEDFPVSDAVKKELMKVRFMSVHLHKSCEIVTSSGNAVMNTERQLACVSSVATYYELSEKRKALRKLPKAQQTKEVQDELEKLDDMIDDLNGYLDDLVDMSTGKATMKSLPSYIRLNNNKEELKSLVNETSLVLTSDAEKLRDRIAGLDEIDDVVSRKKRIDANKIGKSIKFAVSRKGTYKDGNSMSFAIDNILRYRGITLSQHALETWRPGTTDVTDKTDEYQEKMEKLADRFDSGDVDILDYARLINKVLPDASIRHRKIDKKALKSDAGANALKSTFREAVKEDRSPLALKMNGKYYTVTSFVESEEEGAKVTLSYQNEKDITLSIEELMAKSTETAPKDAPAEEKHQYNTGIELTWLKDIAFTKNTAAHLRTLEKNGVVSWIKGDVVESYHISSDAEMEAYKVMHPEDYAEWKKVNDMRKESLSSLTTRVIKHKDGSVVFLDDDSKVEVRGREIERVNGFLAKEDICVEEKGLGKNVTGETIYPNRYEELKKVEADEIKELNKALYDEKKTGLDHSNATKALLEQKASVPSLIENMIDQSIQRSLMNFQSEFRKLSSAENTDEFFSGKAEVEKKFKSKLDKYEEFRKAQDRIKELDHRWKDPNPVSLDKITENKTLALNAAEDFRKRLSDNNASGAVAAYGLVVCYINPVKKVLSWSKRRELSKNAVSVSGLRKAFKEAYDKVEKEYDECGKEVDEFYANRRKEQEKKVALGEMDESKITKGLAYKFTFKDLPEIFRVTDDPAIIKQLLDSKVPIHPEAREMLEYRLTAIKKINNNTNRKEFIKGNKCISGNWYDISLKGVSDAEYEEMTSTQYKEYEYSFKISDIGGELHTVNAEITSLENKLKENSKDSSIKNKLSKLVARKDKLLKQSIEYNTKKGECIDKLAQFDEKKKTLKKVYMQPVSDKLEKFKNFKFSKSNDIMADYLSVMLTFATGKQQDANIISGYRPSMDLTKGIDDECMKYMESQQREQFKDIADYADLTTNVLTGAALQQYEIDITKIKGKGKRASNVDRNEVANKIKNLVIYNVNAQSSPLCLKTQSGTYVLVTGYMEGGKDEDYTEDKLLTLSITAEGKLTESTISVYDLLDYGQDSKQDCIKLFSFQSVDAMAFLPTGASIKYNKNSGEISSIKGNEEASAHQSNCVRFCTDEQNIGKVTTYYPKTVVSQKKANKDQIVSSQAANAEQYGEILIHQTKTEADFKRAEEGLRTTARHFIESGKKLEYSELGYYTGCGDVDMLNHLLVHQSDILSENVKKILKERVDAISKVAEICEKAAIKDTQCKEITLDDGTSEIRIDSTKYDSTSSSNAGKWSDAMSFLLSTKGITVNADTLEKYKPEISYSGMSSYRFLHTQTTEPGEIEDYVNILDYTAQKDMMLNVKDYNFSKDADVEKVVPVLKNQVKELFQDNGSGVVLKIPGDPDMYRNVVGIKGDSLIIKASVGLGTDEQYKGDEYTDKYVEKELGRGTMEYELPLSELKGKKFSFVSLTKSLSDYDEMKRKETVKDAYKGIEKDKYVVSNHQDKMAKFGRLSHKVCDGLKGSENTWISRQYVSEHIAEAMEKAHEEEVQVVEKTVEKNEAEQPKEKKTETKAEKKAREKKEKEEKKRLEAEEKQRKLDEEKRKKEEKKRLEAEEKQRKLDEEKRKKEEEKRKKEEEKAAKLKREADEKEAKRKEKEEKKRLAEEEKKRKAAAKKRKEEEEDEHNLRFVNEEYYQGDGMGGDFM